jgi:hypothetical protein
MKEFNLPKKFRKSLNILIKIEIHLWIKRNPIKINKNSNKLINKFNKDFQKFLKVKLEMM